MAIDILNPLDKRTSPPRRKGNTVTAARPNRRRVNTKETPTTSRPADKNRRGWIQLSEIDLLDLLDKKTRTPLGNPGHPERRRINILDVMDAPVLAAPAQKQTTPIEKNGLAAAAAATTTKGNSIDLLTLLDKKTRTPLGNPGHPELRRINILDVMDAPVPASGQKKKAMTKKKKNSPAATDLLTLLDKKTRTPLGNPGHPERRRINILDVMDLPPPASKTAASTTKNGDEDVTMA